MNQHPPDFSSGLGEGFHARKRLRLVWADKAILAAITLAGLGAGFLYMHLQTPSYKAHALVHIEPPYHNPSGASQTQTTTALGGHNDRSYYRTQYRLIRSRPTGEKALKKLGLWEQRPFRDAADPSATLMAHIQVTPLPGTRLAHIAATHTNPDTAALWANTVAEAYVDQNIQAKIETSLGIYKWLLERLGAARDEVGPSEQETLHLYEATLQKVKEANAVAHLWGGNVSIVERAIAPTAPFRPQPAKNLILGLVGGFALGCGLVLLRHHLDNTIKNQEDIEHYLKLDCLAVSPLHEDADDGALPDAYRSLRASLLFSRECERGNVVLVTSTTPGEGKSVTALNLARALAGSGEPTLLIDFDLRRGSLHTRLQLSSRPGLADYCVRDLPLLHTIIQKTRYSNLSAITPGRLPTNPPAFVGSPAVKRLLEEARERYAWIVLDAPALVGVTDPLLLAKLADMVLLVVRSNAVDRKRVRRGVKSLLESKARLIGAVLNGVDPGREGSGGAHFTDIHKPPTQPATVTPIRHARSGR